MWSTNEVVGGVVLAGESGHFCGGADLDWLAENRSASGELFGAIGGLYETVASFPKPVIALLNGEINGAGLGLADTPYRVATEASRFSVSEPSLGLVPDGPLLRMLSLCDAKVGLPVRAYLSLTGKGLDGHSLVRLGLATHFVPDAQSTEAFVRHLSTAAVAAPGAQALLDGGRLHDVLTLFCALTAEGSAAYEEAARGVLADSGIALPPPIDAPPFDEDERTAVGRCFRGDSVSEIWTSLEARGDDEWALECLEALKGSPALSLAATFMLGKECAKLEAAEASALSRIVATNLAKSATFSDVVAHAAAGSEAKETTLAEVKAAEGEVSALFVR